LSDEAEDNLGQDKRNGISQMKTWRSPSSIVTIRFYRGIEKPRLQVLKKEINPVLQG